NPFKEVHKEATTEQLTAARISFYLELLDISDLAAKNHVLVIRSDKNLDKKQKKKAQADTRGALIDLYFIREGKLDPKAFEDYWGESANEIGHMLDDIFPQLQQSSEDHNKRAPSLDSIDRIRISLKARKQLKNLPEEQKSQLLSLVGYTDPKERAKVLKKIGFSGLLTGISTIPYTLGIAGAIALEKTNPIIHLDDISNRSTQIAIALSYLLSYSTTFAVNQTNIRLLRDPNINTCPNIFSTSLYFLLKKLMPEKELMADLGVTVGTFTPSLIQEPAVISSLFIPVLGPQVVLARNIAGGILNLGQAGINEIWLKRKGKK
ncbi:MAG: hypothetical protein Q7T59_00890, partial [Candidatus Woesebacteria bacterium]|nr:hypothetical protein [Candidatus Woesebacteria bacterium]